MERKEAKQFLPLIKAFADGKTIQLRVNKNANWTDLKSPTFDYPASCYRIKPKGTNVSLDEVFRYNNIDYENINMFGNCRTNIKMNNYIIAYCIAEYYNKGWKPDWKDTSKEKYCIARDNNLFVASRLFPAGEIFFKNKADAEEVINNPTFIKYFEIIIQ